MMDLRLPVLLTSKLVAWATLLISGGYFVWLLSVDGSPGETERENSPNRGRVLVARIALLVAAALDILMLPSPFEWVVRGCEWDFFWPPYLGSFVALILSALLAYSVKGIAASRLRIVTTVLLGISMIGIWGYVADYPNDVYYRCLVPKSNPAEHR
jgi:hypothetical protein